MKYRKFGSTGLEISEIVFGAGAVGGLVFKPDRQTRLEAVRKALDYGINWIDTAPSYGDGQSEENLGWILKELGARPYLSTKVSIRPEHVDDIAGEIDRSIEASLKRLQVDSVDLIQLHSHVTRTAGARRNSISIDNVLGDNGVLAGFERLRERGLARFFGFTGMGETDCLHELITSGRFHSVQAYHNLLNPSAGRLVPDGFSAQDYGNLIGLAAQHGVGVLNIRVMAAGAIAGQEPPGGPNAGLSPGSTASADMERAAKLRDALGQEAESMAQTAVRFALTNPGVSGVLVGFSQLEHIDEAVAAVDMGTLSDDVMRTLDAFYAADVGSD
ncbi:MAG: aldo/keto reductase [Chloroflexi bacterium]|nr:aldo/keto reductase [Chloroflexota bacterium]